MQRVVDMLKTVLWTNWSLYLRAIVCTMIVDKSRPPFHANHWCDCCRFVPDLPVAIIVEFAAIGWDSRAHALLSAARVVSKSPFCNVGGCCCQIFTFKALLQINRKYQHVDVGLTPIGDKLCVKVVDSVHVVHMSIYELRQLKHFTFTHTHQKKFMANIAEMLPLRNLRAADRQQSALFQINAHSHLSNFLTPCETARTLSKTVNTASNWLHREFLGSFISSSHHQPQMQWHVNTQSYCKVTHMLGIFEPGTETISSMTCARNSWQSAVWFHQVSSLTGQGMNPPFWFFSPPENMSQKLACCTSLTFKTPEKTKKTLVVYYVFFMFNKSEDNWRQASREGVNQPMRTQQSKQKADMLHKSAKLDI